MALDILILAAVAGFLAWRLYLVLGEKQDSSLDDARPDPFQKPAPKAAPAPDRASAAKPVEAVVIEPDAVRSLDGGLKEIAAADPSFDEKSFLRGAKAAFEMILKAYAAGDTSTLKPLLGDDLYHSFADDIRARQARGETMELKVKNVRDADICSARMDRTTALVGVHFTSEQSSFVKDSAGEIISGDAETFQIVSDHWVFARNTRSTAPDWQLVETLND